MARLVTVCVVASLFFVSSARAQSPRADRRLFEVGGGVLSIMYGNQITLPTIQGRVNLTRGVAFETSGSFDRTRYGMRGFYQLNAVFRPGAAGSRIRPFGVVGVLADFVRETYPERRYSTTNGTEIVRPSVRAHRIHPPEAIVGGGGVTVALGRRTSLEAGVRLGLAEGGFALLPTVGVTVPFGRRR